MVALAIRQHRVLTELQNVLSTKFHGCGVYLLVEFLPIAHSSLFFIEDEVTCFES